MAGDPFDMDPRIRNYLKSMGDSRSPTDDPQYMFGKGAIESAGLGGIARGMAQMGTVHGKSASAEPFVQSQEKGLVGLQGMAKEPVVDPQVMQYIMNRNKHPGSANATKVESWKQGSVTPTGDQTYYRTTPEAKLETVIGGKVRTPPPPGSTPKQPGVPEHKSQANFRQGVLSEKQFQDATTGESAWDPTQQFQFINSSHQKFLTQFKDPKAQAAHAAMDSWVETFLRDASGAAITGSERPDYFAIYFPVAGDTPQVIQQKKEQRVQKMKNAAASGLISEQELNTALGTISGGKAPMSGDDKALLKKLRDMEAAGGGQ